MKSIFLLTIGFTIILTGCSSGIRFFVCPYEVSEKIRSESDIGQRREILWGMEYRVLVVHKTPSDEIIPVPHYRPEHTFGNRTHPIKVSFEKPLTLGTLIIIENLQKPLGIAIKDKGDIDWRIYWLQNEDYDELKENGVIYLPRYKDLPFIMVVGQDKRATAYSHSNGPKSMG